jgi:excinuclease ABC subunit C
MTTVPRDFVCIDISTNQGKDTVGSLVWFEGGRPKKAEYRLFKIKSPDAQQDDCAAVHEVVSRFVTRRVSENKSLPDLMVIDGGKGQLSAARSALAEQQLDTLPLASLAKRDEEIFLPGRAESIRLPRRSPSLKLLQRARDEAHRFAVTYNRKRRKARTITSELMNIAGVGPSRRRALLTQFGSLAGVRLASAAEIAALPGFSLRLAERVLNHLET